MHMRLDPKLEEFRLHVKDFIKQNLTDELRQAGQRNAGIYNERPAALAWLKILNQQGWAVPAWPKEHGGTGWDIAQQYIFQREMVLANAPAITPNATRMVGPVIMAFGSDAQIEHYLPRIRNGEDWWAQGYSEPGSGSDLASLQCKAVREVDQYIINGTKIWTTHAHWSNKMFCLVRTDNSGKPQQGISFLLFDMDNPGISIEPIISISGDHELNQVFFDNARVPTSSLLHKENDGWTVAKYLLQYERSGSYAPALQVKLAKLKTMAATQHNNTGIALISDPQMQHKFADAEVRLQTLEASELRVLAGATKGDSVGFMSSMMKVKGTEARQLITELGVEVIGYYALPLQTSARQPGSNLAFVGPEYALTPVPQYLNDRAATIYAGSNEVQRNIMAKAVLGL